GGTAPWGAAPGPLPAGCSRMANSPASIRSVSPATGPSHQSQPAKPERGFSAENQLSSSTVPSGSESTPWLNAYGLGPATAGRPGSSAANAPPSTRHSAALRARERSTSLMTDPPVLRLTDVASETLLRIDAAINLCRCVRKESA